MEDIEAEIVITGRVQAVGLRAMIKDKADELGVRGNVRNAEDGSIEVLAQGEREQLVEFVERIKRGTPFSKIDDVEVTWFPKAGDHATDFSIE